MDNDTEAPKDPGVKDNQRYTEQDFEGNMSRKPVKLSNLPYDNQFSIQFLIC